jgi:hypothetical protein
MIEPPRGKKLAEPESLEMVRRTWITIVGLCVTAGANGQDTSLQASSESARLTDQYSHALAAMQAVPGFHEAVGVVCRGMGGKDYIWDGKQLNFDMWFDDSPIVMSMRCEMRPLTPGAHVTAWKGTVDICALTPGMDDVRPVIVKVNLRLPEKCELGTRAVAEHYAGPLMQQFHQECDGYKDPTEEQKREAAYERCRWLYATADYYDALSVGLNPQELAETRREWYQRAFH